MKQNNLLFQYSLATTLIFSVAFIGNFLIRHQSILLFSLYTIAFVAYLYLSNSNLRLKELLVISIASRIALFFSLPTLSDDVFRFIWDGTLLKNGIHPFNELPEFYLNKNIDGLSPELFAMLNSKEYFTIYPPINQLIFWLSALIGDGNLWLSTNFIRIIIIASEGVTFFFLTRLINHFQLSKKVLSLYFLNPLIILEFVGNLHFEALVVSFLLVGIYYYEVNQKWKAALGFGLAIGTKLIPLIFLPFIFFKGIKSNRWQIGIYAGIIGLATLLPLLSPSFIKGMESSLSLYFKTFEFNASIYFLIREIGLWFYGYNLIAKIGPALSILSASIILGLSVFFGIKNWETPSGLLIILCIYLLLATSVHPWYVTPVVALSILSRLNFGVIWSFLIIITYLGYSLTGYELPLYLIALEYIIVLVVFVIEVKKKIAYNENIFCNSTIK